jgi:hypothetical protein
MIKDKIIAQCCKEKIKDISTKICYNQETNSLPEDVILRPRGWIHIGGEEIMIRSTENKVHRSPAGKHGNKSLAQRLLSKQKHFRKAMYKVPNLRIILGSNGRGLV